MISGVRRRRLALFPTLVASVTRDKAIGTNFSCHALKGQQVATSPLEGREKWPDLIPEDTTVETYLCL